MRRRGANHVLHLLLSLFTLGLWTPVWLLSSIRVGGWRCTQCGALLRLTMWEKFLKGSAYTVMVLMGLALATRFGHRTDRNPGMAAPLSGPVAVPVAPVAVLTVTEEVQVAPLLERLNSQKSKDVGILSARFAQDDPFCVVVVLDLSALEGFWESASQRRKTFDALAAVWKDVNPRFYVRAEDSASGAVLGAYGR